MPLANAGTCRSYEPRSAQSTLVHRAVSAELDGFLADARERGHPLPRFVETTFRDFLECGLPEHGFVRMHCDGCGHDRVVPFSCKRRGVCSSCAGRRMAETAAHLVDHVLPQVPIRQWVLTLPYSLRYRLAYERRLLTPVLAAFLRAVFASLRRRARDELGIRRAKCGAVSFVQRFGGALNLNVHFHCLVLEGVYEVLPDSRGIRFATLAAPVTPEVLRVLTDAAERIAVALGRSGFGEDRQDELARDNPLLAALYAAAVEGRNATGTDAGRKVTRIGRPTAMARPDEVVLPQCAVLGGCSLHAGVFHAHVYPGPILIFGSSWGTWTLALLVGTIVGYFVLHSTYSDPGAPAAPRYLALRYVFCVYFCALGAQWFAFAFDSNTTLLPPAEMSPLRYYLHPLAGPKTLYGAVLLLPLAALAFVPGSSLGWQAALDRSTPTLFSILTFARIGCFLQGCCFGLRSETFGLIFPPGSDVQGEQLTSGLIAYGEHSLPVLPTQIGSALACAALAVWSRRALRLGQSEVFLKALGAYSAFRFGLEFLRADEARNYLGQFSTSQWIAIAILAAMGMRVFSRRPAPG